MFRDGKLISQQSLELAVQQAQADTLHIRAIRLLAFWQELNGEDGINTSFFQKKLESFIRITNKPLWRGMWAVTPEGEIFGNFPPMDALQNAFLFFFRGTALEAKSSLLTERFEGKKTFYSSQALTFFRILSGLLRFDEKIDEEALFATEPLGKMLESIFVSTFKKYAQGEDRPYSFTSVKPEMGPSLQSQQLLTFKENWLAALHNPAMTYQDYLVLRKQAELALGEILRIGHTRNDMTEGRVWKDFCRNYDNTVEEFIELLRNSVQLPKTDLKTYLAESKKLLAATLLA